MTANSAFLFTFGALLAYPIAITIRVGTRAGVGFLARRIFP